MIENWRIRAAWALMVCGAPLATGGACSGSDFSGERDKRADGEAGEPGSGGNGGSRGGSPSLGGSGGNLGGEAGEGTTGGRGGSGGRGGAGSSGEAGGTSTGGEAGGTSTGGEAGETSTGGQTGSGGSGGAGNGGIGGGGNAGIGGKSGAGGTNDAGRAGSSGAGAGTGGAGAGGAGAGGASGSGGKSGLPETCIVRVAEAGQPIIYSGVATNNACSPFIDPPRSGVWRSFGDGSSAATAVGALGGRGTAPDCSMHNQGANFTDWGAGMGFGLNMGQSAFCRYDASVFQGVRMYLKGSATGSTNSPAGALAHNWVRVGLATVQTASADEGGSCVPGGGKTCNDHWSKFCQLGTDWTLCDLSLSGTGLAQWGFGAPVTFSKGYLLEIVFEVHRASSAPVVDFDFAVDDISFY
jgi:hypothetical protein